MATTTKKENKQTMSKEKAKEPEVRGVAHTGHSAMIGVPARDLTLDEIDELGLDINALVASGAYVHVYVEAESEDKEPETSKSKSKE